MGSGQEDWARRERGTFQIADPEHEREHHQHMAFGMSSPSLSLSLSLSLLPTLLPMLALSLSLSLADLALLPLPFRPPRQRRRQRTRRRASSAAARGSSSGTRSTPCACACRHRRPEEEEEEALSAEEEEEEEALSAEERGRTRERWTAFERFYERKAYVLERAAGRAAACAREKESAHAREKEGGERAGRGWDEGGKSGAGEGGTERGLRVAPRQLPSLALSPSAALSRASVSNLPRSLPLVRGRGIFTGPWAVPRTAAAVAERGRAERAALRRVRSDKARLAGRNGGRRPSGAVARRRLPRGRRGGRGLLGGDRADRARQVPPAGRRRVPAHAAGPHPTRRTAGLHPWHPAHPRPAGPLSGGKEQRTAQHDMRRDPA